MAPFRCKADAKGTRYVAATQGQRVEERDSDNEQGGKGNGIVTCDIPLALAMADGTGNAHGHLGTAVGCRAGGHGLSGQKLKGRQLGNVKRGSTVVPEQYTALDRHDHEQKCEEPVGPSAHHSCVASTYRPQGRNRKRHSHSSAVNTMA